MALGVKSVEDSYQSFFEKMDEMGLDVVIETLCLLITTWLDINKSTKKTMLRMELQLIPKVWYQLLKHSLRPTTHNEFVNKVRLMFIHCITTCSSINITKIIFQEIHVCAKKTDGMLYFPSLNTALCKRHEVPDKPIDDICNPKVRFDKAVVLNLLNAKGIKRKLEASSSCNNEELLWDTLQQMQRDQLELCRLVKEQNIWHKRLYSLHKGVAMKLPLIFS